MGNKAIQAELKGAAKLTQDHIWRESQRGDNLQSLHKIADDLAASSQEYRYDALTKGKKML